MHYLGNLQTDATKRAELSNVGERNDLCLVCVCPFCRKLQVRTHNWTRRPLKIPLWFNNQVTGCSNYLCPLAFSQINRDLWFTSSRMLSRVDWQIVTDVSENCSSSIFRVKESKKHSVSLADTDDVDPTLPKILINISLSTGH